MTVRNNPNALIATTMPTTVSVVRSLCRSAFLTTRRRKYIADTKAASLPHAARASLRTLSTGGMEVAFLTAKRRLWAGLEPISAKMHPTHGTYGPRAAVPVYAPFRFLVAVAMALLIATVIASSTAHGMALGDALAQSTLGSPLRAVIPISTAPGELPQVSCFRVVPAGDGSAQTVTAQVSLERTASAFRLVVTTQNPVIESVIRFGVQAGCETMSRRDYVLLLNPQVAGAPAVAAVQTTAREPGQERPVLPPAAARRNAQPAATASDSRAAPRSAPAAGAGFERHPEQLVA